MPTTPLPSVLQAVLSGTRHGPWLRTDAELLAAFASARDEAAFAELVRRYGRLVLGVARRVAGGAGDADDVFQATFLLLARKAAASWGPTVGPWLYQAARRIAAKARARAARRPASPLRADVPAPPADPSAGLAWAEVRAALDDALGALPARLRDPLVLCYLEGLTQDEAAAALGCSPAAVKGRVARGRERLRRLLARRGLSLSAALAGLLVAGRAVGEGVTAATARAAVLFRATGAAPPAVRALLRGAVTGWVPVAGLFGLVLACAAAVVGVAGPRPADPPPPAAVVAGRRPAKPAVDALGDPLPAGAVARLGTGRLFGFGQPAWATFSPDGKKLMTWGFFGATVWDSATGRKLVERTQYNLVVNAAGWRADGTGVAVIQLRDLSLFVSAFTDPEEKLSKPPQVFPKVVPNPYLHYLALSPDATRLAAVRNPDGARFTIDLLPATPGRPVSGLKPLRTLGPFPGPCRDVRYTAGGRLLTLHGPAVDKGEWSVAFIDLTRNKVARTVRIPAPGYCPWQYMLGLSADARLAAVPPRTKDSPNEHDGTIRIWDLSAGKQLRSLPFSNGGYGYGTGHAFTPDGKKLITSTPEHLFQVWDLATGKEVARSPARAGRSNRLWAEAVAVSPDGKRFATARRDGRVDLWDTATGKPVVSLAAHRDQIDAAAVSPDGRLVATLGYDDSVRVWELATGKPMRVIPAPRGKDPAGRDWTKRRPAFTPEGRGLLFASAGGLAMADPATGKRLDLPAGLRGRRGYVGGFAADGRTLATFTSDKVTLWDWPAGTARLTVTVPLAPRKAPAGKEAREVVGVSSVALSPDGRLLFTNSSRGNSAPSIGWIQNANDVWDARTGKHLHRLTRPETWYPPAAFAPDGRVMYLGGHSLDFPGRGRKQADALTAWDPAAGKFLRRLADPGADRAPRKEGRNVKALALSPDGRLLAAAEYGPGDLCLYETASGRVLKKLAGHSRLVNDLVFSPEGRRLVSVSEDQTGLVWDVTLPALAGARGGKRSEAWDRLAALDPRLGYAGMAALAADPAKGVPLLRARLRPAVRPTEAELDRVVAQLGADEFADREKAAAELERFGPYAVAGAKARLARATSAEVRARLTRFLRRYDGPDPSPYHLRCVRGVATLEAMSTAGARALLAELAKGPADDLLTREARGASRRGGR